MAEDFVHRGFTREQSVAFAYFNIADRMADLGKHLQDFVDDPQDERAEIPEVPAKCPTRRMLQKKNTADAAVDRQDNRCFFLDGPGGTGKTYLIIQSTTLLPDRPLCLQTYYISLKQIIVYEETTKRDEDANGN
ncbi:unnamed protein product [Heligmosomoides polygyrus]|uniref:ATP-dependent DNA helicase n=1 Tax=Heligmosomoides polygyrus TaxID=6339 RepID=A0A183GHH1_HELPZ|nr:unnamed protein product [Heligmosomoides polygyrus]